MPKLRHRRLVSRLLQCRAHLVICLRADEKLKMEKVDGKMVIIQPKDLPVEERWVPIVEKRFPYELTTSLLLTPARPGVPIPIKLQAQHRAAVPLDRPLSEDTGRALAAWARGGAASTETTTGAAPDLTEEAAEIPADPLFTEAREKASDGSSVYWPWFDALPKDQRTKLKPIGRELDQRVAAADERASAA